MFPKKGSCLPLLDINEKNSLVSLSVLFRLEERRAGCVGLVLSGLQKQLSRLPVPYSRQQEEADEHGLCRCCSALAAFVKPFTEEVARKNGNHINTPEQKELRAELLKL